MKTNLTLVNRTLLIVAEKPQNRDELKTLFEELGCKVVQDENESQALGTLKNGFKPDMVLLEAEAPINSTIDFVRNVRSLYEDIPSVFIVCDSVDPLFADAFFEGVDAIFVRPINAEEVEKGVAFSYAESLENCNRAHQRKRIQRARVSYEFDWQKATGYATNFSLGGMFVGSMDQLPVKNQKIKFKLSFEEEAGRELTGYAVVKWLRSNLKFGRPRGFGIEFVGLDHATQVKLSQMLEVGAAMTTTEKPPGGCGDKV